MAKSSRARGQQAPLSAYAQAGKRAYDRSISRIARPPAASEEVVAATRGMADDVKRRVQALSVGGEEAVPKTQEFSVTPRQLVQGWYQNAPGGIDRAVELSQRALDAYGTPNLYGLWNSQALDLPLQFSAQHPSLDSNWGKLSKQGSYHYSGGRPRVELLAGLRDDDPAAFLTQPFVRSVMEHEATHAFTDPSNSRMPLSAQHAHRPFYRPGASEFEDGDLSFLLSAYVKNPELLAKLLDDAARTDAGRTWFTNAADRMKYWTYNSELDPHVAEVRRRFAHSTGRQVSTPEQAAQAWAWYGEMLPFMEASEQPPALKSHQHGFYSRLPQDARQTIYRRMTQVPAVLGGLVGANAATNQEDGLSNAEYR